MLNNIFSKNKEKGVSLIITFFVLTIILAIVLNISALLYSGIKIIRNIGNSVFAFYAADSGVEKFLYYDRQQIPVNARRGFCDINNVCPNDCIPGPNGDAGTCVERHCQGWQATGSDCDPLTCRDCEASFNSFFDGKTYKATIKTTTNDDIFTTDAEFKGSYKSILRKIKLQIISR